MSAAGLLEGKLVLVSGGTQGVGAAVAREAGREGGSVVVTGRSEAKGEEVVADVRATGAKARFLRCDVSDVEQIRAAVRRVVAEQGPIDCLVNCAGLTTRGTLVETSPELFDQHIAVNLRGPFFLMQEVVQPLLAAGRPGTIVNIITMSQHGGQPFLAPYVAAKAGLAGVTKNAAHAHRWDRIRINGLNIGWTDSEGEDAIQREFHAADDGWRERAAASQPMGKLGQVEEIAAMVVFLLSERSGVVTGSIIDWDQIVIGGLD
jgi:NAD(P)-dependent dehydrogenase (short-subunit alcohol dehydrogenase family)